MFLIVIFAQILRLYNNNQKHLRQIRMIMKKDLSMG